MLQSPRSRELFPARTFRATHRMHPVTKTILLGVRQLRIDILQDDIKRRLHSSDTFHTTLAIYSAYDRPHDTSHLINAEPRSSFRLSQPDIATLAVRETSLEMVVCDYRPQRDHWSQLTIPKEKKISFGSATWQGAQGRSCLPSN